MPRRSVVTPNLRPSAAATDPRKGVVLHGPLPLPFRRRQLAEAQLGEAARPAEHGCQEAVRRPAAGAPSELACLIRGGSPSLARGRLLSGSASVPPPPPIDALLGRSVGGLGGQKLRFRPQLFWQEVRSRCIRLRLGHMGCSLGTSSCRLNPSGGRDLGRREGRACRRGALVVDARCRRGRGARVCGLVSGSRLVVGVQP